MLHFSVILLTVCKFPIFAILLPRSIQILSVQALRICSINHFEKLNRKSRPGSPQFGSNIHRDYRQYLAEWIALTSLLTTSQSTPRFGVSVPGTGSSERTHLKEAATSFFDRLTELEGLSSQYPLSRQDPEMRDRVGKEAEDIVVQTYGAFIGRCQGKGLEKCE